MEGPFKVPCQSYKGWDEGDERYQYPHRGHRAYLQGKSINFFKGNRNKWVSCQTWAGLGGGPRNHLLTGSGEMATRKTNSLFPVPRSTSCQLVVGNTNYSSSVTRSTKPTLAVHPQPARQLPNISSVMKSSTTDFVRSKSITNIEVIIHELIMLITLDYPYCLSPN